MSEIALTLENIDCVAVLGNTTVQILLHSCSRCLKE
jgi:hypothetical protein